MSKAAVWLWFVVVQVLSLITMVLGWLLLIPFCIARAWKADGKIDRWSWEPLNSIYGNPEDGVSGACARIWNSTGCLLPYMPLAHPAWRAYCWSAWRNSADNLKYVFRRTGGPFYRVEFRGFYFQCGWNTSGMPVLSVGAL